MNIRELSMVVFGCALLLGSVVWSDETPAAATQETVTQSPSTRPADYSTPKAALKTLEGIQNEGSAQRAVVAYAATNDEEKEVARALAGADAATGKLRMLAVKKFGPEANEPITHALRDVTTADIDAATVKIEDDTATVSGKFFSDPLEMVKVDGKWRISVAKMIETAGSAAGIKEICNGFVKAVDTTVTEFESGKFANISLLERAINRRMSALLGDE